MQFKFLFDLLPADWTWHAAVALIMDVIIIAVVGILKKYVFVKIQNKDLKKMLLFYTSIALSFAATAIDFLIEKISFNYYIIASLSVSAGCILSYAGYENSLARKGKDVIVAWLTKKQTLKGLKDLKGKDLNQAKEIVYNAGRDLVKEVQDKVIKAVDDNDLKNL